MSNIPHTLRFLLFLTVSAVMGALAAGALILALAQEPGEGDIGDADERGERHMNERPLDEFPEARSDAFLCADSAELHYAVSESGMTGLAADDSGHFALYGLPAADGRPSVESYELLRDCAPDLAFANFPSVGIDVPDEGFERLEAEPVIPVDAVQTENRVENGSLYTTYSFEAEQVELVQKLSLEGEDLRIGYTVKNTAQSAHTVTLKSLLSPTPNTGAGEQEPSFTIVRAPGEDEYPGGNEVKYERTLRPLEDHFQSLRVPRPAAASNSSIDVRFEDPQPEMVVAAGFLDLSVPQLIYPTRIAYPLPDNPALATYYERELEAGQQFGVSYTVAIGPDRSRH